MDILFENDQNVLKFSICYAPTGVSPTNQKIFIKGLARNSQTLEELAVNKSTKILLVGSTHDQLEDVSSTPSTSTVSVTFFCVTLHRVRHLQLNVLQLTLYKHCMYFYKS